MPKNLACPTPLSRALRDARKARGWTQAELAKHAGMVERTARALERGHGSVDMFGKAVSALGLVLGYRNAADATPHEVVRTLRERRGLSQRELARLAGVSPPTVGTLERGDAGQLGPLERVLTTLGAGAYLRAEGQARPFYTHVGNSSVGQAWATPRGLLEVLEAAFGRFDLDPCSPRRRGPVKARVHFTAEDDGLRLPWKGRVFVNPPYGRGLGDWVAKARSEHESGHATLVVLLIPARTDTAYWHGEVAGRSEVVFLRGRLRFGDGKQSAPFPSALVLYGANAAEVASLRDSLRG